LVDGQTGEVFYTVYKESDFGTNLRTGPYADIAIGDVFKEILKNRDPNFSVTSDFVIYRPSYDSPASFVATTVFDGSQFLGSLIVQVSTERVNKIMTSDGRWKEIGLGETGSSILVGQDSLLRSNPRAYLENPEQYFETLRKNGYSEDAIQQIRHAKTPIFFQKVKTDTAEKALRGESGTKLSTDFKGTPILSSYQPINLSNFRWGLITRMDEAEAFAPIRNLGKRTLIAAAILLPIIFLLSSWLSSLFIRPISRILQGTRLLAAGDMNVQVNVPSKDELGELARSFNLMSTSLKEKEDHLQEKITENQSLLLNVLPPSAVKQFQQGERDFADIHTDVTLIYAEIEGFDDFTNNADNSRFLQLLNELMGEFDEAAELFGIEKLKTVGTAYIGGCGLAVPRADHAKQSVDFAIAMLQIVQKFSASHDVNFTLDIGIHSGGIIGGIVGKSKFVYELWGDTMKIVHAVHSSPDENVIQVTEPVLQSLENFYHFKPVAPVFVKSLGEISVWMLDLSSLEKPI
jgi:class 3 adenylate cyclase